MIPEPIIQTNQLRKSYGKFEAVRGLDLCVGPNRITGFLGANGAGKSTTIKMLLGMVKPTAGTGTVLGRKIDDPKASVEMRRVEQLLESLVAQASEGTSIFFSSHQIADVERIADNVCILDKGRLIMDTSMDHLRQSYRQITLVFPEVPVEQEFQLAGVERIRTSGHHMALFASGNTDAVVERARDFHATSIDVAPVALREIYLQTVREN